MTYQPVEGLHYIFDRYAFLNGIMEDASYKTRLNPASPQDDIALAIRLARALYHPDRQTRSGEQMKKQAERMSHMIGDCEKFLTSAEIKPLYDEKLAAFQKNKPNMVSTTGNAIIDLTAEVLDVDSLLSDDVTDTSEFEARIKALTHYDDTEVPQMKALFTSMPENSQVRGLYRKALTNKLTYITLLEDVAWAKVGILNRKNKIDGHLTSSDEYAAKVESALQKVAQTEINTHLEQRGDSVRIGMSQMPLLLTFNPAAQQPASGTALLDPAQMQEILMKMKEKAHQNFQIRADYVRDIARQKQTVLEELVALAPVTKLNVHDDNNPVYDFYLVNPGPDKETILCMQLNAQTGNGTIAEIISPPRPLAGLTAFANNAFAVERNPEISDILVEVSAAMDRVYISVRDRFKAQPDSPAPS